MLKTIVTNIERLRMPAKTENFNVKTDPKLICTCGHPDCDKRSVKQSILNKIQLIRDELDRPLTITSGGRCPNHKSEIKRTTPADHQKCIAVDIAVSNGYERSEIVELGFAFGADAIGVAKGFVHLGWRNNSKLVMWVY